MVIPRTSTKPLLFVGVEGQERFEYTDPGVQRCGWRVLPEINNTTTITTTKETRKKKSRCSQVNSTLSFLFAPFHILPKWRRYYVYRQGASDGYSNTCNITFPAPQLLKRGGKHPTHSLSHASRFNELCNKPWALVLPEFALLFCAMWICCWGFCLFFYILQ